MGTKVDQGEAKLKSSKEDVHSLDSKVSELSNQLVEMDASSSGYRNRVAALEKYFANASAEVKGLNRKRAVEKNLLGGIRAALALYQTALEQLVTVDAKDREELFADNAAIDTIFRKFGEDTQAMIGSIQISLADELKRINALRVSASSYLSPRRVLSVNCS